MGVAVKDGTATQAQPQLTTGEQQVFSYFRPALEGGDYIVATTQTISARDSPSIVTKEEQEFTVATPRFSIAPNTIKSVYPPAGYPVAVETLPHIVFSDPYLPWERLATSARQTATRRVPWLALLAFSEDELTLAPGDLTGDTSLFKDIPSDKPWEQNADLSVAVPHASASKLAGCLTPISSADAAEVDGDKVNAIFVRPSLFNELFRDTSASSAGGSQKRPDVSRYGYLAHVRRIDTTGMAESGGTEDAHFSLVLSHRVGPMASDGQAATVHVHLVSIEGIEAMAWPVSSSTRFVALASLHSWSYMSARHGVFDAKKTMRKLAETLGPLRPPLPAQETLKVDPARQVIIDRLRDGYTPVAYRMQTGEKTAALYRGVLTPTLVPHPISPGWSLMSESGMDLQILDNKLGILDITYSTAWQLGKSTAMADLAFCRSLTKLRTKIHVMAMNRAKAKMMRALGAYQNRADAVKAAPVILQELGKLQEIETDGLVPSQSPDMLDRWKADAKKTVDLSLDNRALAAQYDEQAKLAAEELGSGFDAGEVAGEGQAIYNELNEASSPEWAVVLGWILDKMYLSTIPTQYLVTDPSHLPAESLRFFHLDPNWLDAFLDGALSVGNHLENRFDSARTAIKHLINRYLRSPLPATGQPPPVPTYGFILRSDLISHYPDLRVEVEYDPPRANSAMPSILRQANVADGVLMCLLDASPHGTQPNSRLKSLKFTQPPHQQSFAVGAQLDDEELHTSYRRIYTTYDGHSDKSDPLCNDEVLKKDSVATDVQPIFCWGKDNSVRCLQFPAFSDRLLRNLQQHMPRDSIVTFSADAATSAMVGLQLTKRICELEITAGPATDPQTLPMLLARASEPGARALWIRPERESGAMSKSMVANSWSLPIPNPPVAPLPSLEERRRIRREADAVWSGVAPHASGTQVLSPELEDIITTAFQVVFNPGGFLLDRVLDFFTPTIERPRYDLQVFPVGKRFDPEKDARSIPTGRRQDLVFSVSLANPDTATPGDTLLDEIRIMIPMGDPTADSDKTCLMSNYRGPGATMVSNLRFNVITAVAHDYSYMLLRLIPRTARNDGCIGFEHALEASFVLNLVDVNEYPGGQERTVEISLVEHLKDVMREHIPLVPRTYQATLKTPPLDQGIVPR
ncbi:uncharacterized protein TRIVIDRAFT_180219 [Trichoderma virens Gv29-8]|uniref:Uncharacterized protein n=1 Tax=Hypocrea virens (strain Gv29-8 / FGSC 10586) TaxID=413071 RepID=G9MU43_HYPVG|nr:uncharacterized protein TRIVIDRAFT_180219 [Trichoderma virens Gv29-8]EHK22038.1 hypothetical protein TRIVIDRAFT_180219 [Trichoderma virens Gv29-8]